MKTSILVAALLSLAIGCGAVDAAGPAEETFTLMAEWGPIASSHHGFHLEQGSGLAEVLNPGPRFVRATYTWDDIAPLLPADDVEVGAVWKVDVEAVVAFVKQLHPSATSHLHHHNTLADSDMAYGTLGDRSIDLAGHAAPDAPLGAHATLLAREPEIDILVRAHVEFQLRDRTVFYTPSQFEGRLVVDPSAQTVRAFHLSVPDRDSNVDINVNDEGEEYGRVDIGHVRRLGLRTATGPPAIDDVILDGARLRLRREFYRFASIDWLSLDEAVERARGGGRPLHVVILLGALDDESC